MKRYLFLLVLLTTSCSQDLDDSQEDNTLSAAVVGEEVVLGNVTACAVINDDPTMPLFFWQDGTFDDTAIYFQVVSYANDELFSGMYTFEQLFQYYDLENVVLNITEVQPPPILVEGQGYNFTLMAVSEDNWVNLFAKRTFNLN